MGLSSSGQTVRIEVKKGTNTEITWAKLITLEFIAHRPKSAIWFQFQKPKSAVVFYALILPKQANQKHGGQKTSSFLNAGVAQRQSIALWMRGLWVRNPSPTPGNWPYQVDRAFLLFTVSRNRMGVLSQAVPVLSSWSKGLYWIRTNVKLNINSIYLHCVTL